MNEEETRSVESSQRQHHQELEHFSKLSFAVEQEELGRFSLLKPKIFIDGDQWCVLYGDNVQEGIAGFGSTPNEAIFAWNAQWNKELSAKPETVGCFSCDADFIPESKNDRDEGWFCDSCLDHPEENAKKVPTSGDE